MPVPTSNIRLSADINAEVSSVNSTSLTTLAANAISYTGGNSPVLTDSLPTPAPHGIREFAGYQHTQNFPTHTYVRYFNSNRSTVSQTSSSNPYKATTGSSNPSITITSSAATMGTTTNATEPGGPAFCSAGVEFRVRRQSSYLYLECRHILGGLSVNAGRYMYRQNGTIQTASATQVGGGGSGLGAGYEQIMRIQTGINPGGLTVAIKGGSSVTSHSTAAGGSTQLMLSTLSGSQATIGNYGSLLNNGHYVGASFLAQAEQDEPPNGIRVSTANGSRILQVHIRATGYFDQQIAACIFKGTASATSRPDGGCQFCCVHDSMLVATEEDMKSVYDIEIGDMIVSHNFETGKDEIVPVTDKIIVDRDVDYKVNNLIMTEDHPVYLEDGRIASINPEATKINYKQIVDQLQIGDKMMTLDGLEEITSIEKYEGNHKNFALQTKHNNFYANGHLVDSVIDRGES